MTPREGLLAQALRDRHPAKSHDPEARTDDQPAAKPNPAVCAICGGPDPDAWNGVTRFHDACAFDGSEVE